MRNIAVLLALFQVFSPLVAFAAETPAPQKIEAFLPTPGEEHVEALDPSLSSCFDHYRFGSTPVIISSNLSNAAQGSTLGFTGKITNENDYPLSDVAIYAKVFYRANPGEKDSFGPDVIDFFPIKQHLTLAARETLPLSFTWDVPSNAEIGAHELATFVVSHDRFNMNGLSFTTDIVGGSAKFGVVGAKTGSTHIDLHQTIAGGTVLHGAAFSPRFDIPGEGLPFTVQLVNTGTINEEGTVSLKLYSWDTLREDTLIEKKEIPVSVPAGGQVPVTYTATDSSKTVYNLLVEYTPKEKGKQRSVQSIRFINTALNLPRLNFVGSDAYPGKKDDTVFACFHSSGTANADGVKVELTATSNNLLDTLTGRGTLAQKSYEGIAPGNIYAVTAPLTRDSDSYTVHAKIFKDGKIIDEVSVPYTCNESGKGCPFPYALVVAIALLVLLCIGGGLYLKNKKRVVEPASSVPTV